MDGKHGTAWRVPRISAVRTGTEPIAGIRDRTGKGIARRHPQAERGQRHGRQLDERRGKGATGLRRRPGTAEGSGAWLSRTGSRPCVWPCAASGRATAGSRPANPRQHPAGLRHASRRDRRRGTLDGDDRKPKSVPANTGIPRKAHRRSAVPRQWTPCLRFRRRDADGRRSRGRRPADQRHRDKRRHGVVADARVWTAA